MDMVLGIALQQVNFLKLCIHHLQELGDRKTAGEQVKWKVCIF